jgi:hypothetical protein
MKLPPIFKTMEKKKMKQESKHWTEDNNVASNTTTELCFQQLFPGRLLRRAVANKTRKVSPHELYSTRDQTTRFAYVTSLWVEEKQMHILCEPNTLSTKKLRQ